MSYFRVIPRDLFNEANLLKCYAQIYIELEKINVEAELNNDGEAFHIVQSSEDGSISITNVQFVIRGEEHILYRPLNARDSWPLYIISDSGDEIRVFNDDGHLSDDMMNYLQGPNIEDTPDL